MILEDYHVHTVYCDGTAEPETMVQAAVAKGMKVLGFSGHSPMPFEDGWSMPQKNIVPYQQEILRLKEAYRGIIEIRLGIEQDYFSEQPTYPYEYRIGAVHYMKVGSEYVSAGQKPELSWLPVAQNYFGGDIFSVIELYYEQIRHVVEVTGCDMIGHLDLITKRNWGGKYFDEADPRYVRAWKAAADELLKTGLPFEINTGAVSRGYREDPYPAKPIRDYLKDHGARFILSSDSHRPETLLYDFEKLESYLSRQG